MQSDAITDAAPQLSSDELRQVRGDIGDQREERREAAPADSALLGVGVGVGVGYTEAAHSEVSKWDEAVRRHSRSSS